MLPQRGSEQVVNMGMGARGVRMLGVGMCVYDAFVCGGVWGWVVSVFSRYRTKGILPRRALTYCCTHQVPTFRRWGFLNREKKMQMSSGEPFYLNLSLKAPRLPKCEKNIHNFG